TIAISRRSNLQRLRKDSFWHFFGLQCIGKSRAQLNQREEFVIAARMIAQNMEVVGSDGLHVGVVDQVEGADEIKLANETSESDGQVHYIPLAWLTHAEVKVHLKLTAD